MSLGAVCTIGPNLRRSGVQLRGRDSASDRAVRYGLDPAQNMYVFLDYFFLVFHGSLVVFNLIGWAWKKTRRLHLATIGLTILSWFGLGIFYGWGYCPSTDWHWQVKRALGETGLPQSYIKYYVDMLTGIYWDPLLIDAIVVVSGLSALILSVWLNWRDWRRSVARLEGDGMRTLP